MSVFNRNEIIFRNEEISDKADIPVAQFEIQIFCLNLQDHKHNTQFKDCKISPLSSQKRVLIMQHPTFLVPISPDNFISSIFIPNILNALMIYCHDLTNKKESRNKTVVLPCRLNVFSISCVPEKPYSTSFASTFPPI